MPLGAKILMGWWIGAIVIGVFAHYWMAFELFDAGNVLGFLVVCALGTALWIGCAVLLYRACNGWDEFRQWL
jgi:uncharacterized membrane protein (DUF485 family)